MIPNINKIVLLHWNGRFGNRMFTYAYLRHYADKNNCPIWLPSHWEGTHLFKESPYDIIDDDILRLNLNQTMHPLDTIQYRLKAILDYNRRTGDNIIFADPDNPDDHNKKNICIDSLCSYHPEIFKQYSAKKLRENYFCFAEKIKNSAIYKHYESNKGNYVVAHLRRDDVSNRNNKTNTGYSVISKASYERAFKKYGINPNEVEWVSDDFTGEWNVGKPSYTDVWEYSTGSAYRKDIHFSWFPDFLKIMFAAKIFRANSSFSWWASFLSDAEVYAPRLHKRELIHETGNELDVEFEEGNHPHWICVKGLDLCEDIIIN